jgi:FlaA1/EpsC-like NDP-sugar epimerase
MSVRFGSVELLLKYRRPFVVALQLGAAALSHFAALWLRFDGDVPPDQVVIFVSILPWLLAIRGLTFIPFRLYEGLWRYAGFWDLRNIVSAALTGSLAFYGLIHWGFGFVSYPRSVFLIDGVLLVFLLGGMRMSRRLYREQSRPTRDKRVLIYGAGDAGEMIVRDMRNNPFYEYDPIGFVDDDAAKVGQRIHGVKVLGTRDDLRRVMADKQPDAILIAISRAEPATIRGIVQALEGFKVPIQTLPNLRDLLDGRVTVSQIRTLSVEDLLHRVPVALETEPVRQIVEGRRVLVTGAGGSIGGELCRQVVALQPRLLVMVDRYENGLHAVACEVTKGAAADRVRAVVADVTDESRMREVWRAYRPEIVLHAAAHKHVPLMEGNPCEAVLNNVRGSRMLVEAAVAHGVERFMLVSTDKAVNPASVMGVTKRVSEMLVQTVSGSSPGVFAAVRFGNVLASRGSVVPRFLEEIKAGGPVSVTHPEMRRYFMLIPEAVGLVLQAVTLAKGSDIFVLEMGEQVKVLDLARHLIRLSGFVPGEEIPIVFTGPRPGEKLSEELVGEDEEVEPSSVASILRIRPRAALEHAALVARIHQLEELAAVGDSAAVLELLRAIVPTYHPLSGGRG